MTDAKEFLEGWFAAFYRFDGLILVLHAYFDETGGSEDKDVTGVAGFVYDKPGLMAFTDAWEPKVRGLSKPYRTSSCNAARGPFSNWETGERERLMEDLASLISDHALAGFVVAMRKCDFEDAAENGPGIRRILDSPYTICLTQVLLEVSKWAMETARSEGVYCWFEDGGHHQKQAHDFVGRLSADANSRADFAGIRGWSWQPKSECVVFDSADLLAWEWQRNILRSPDRWSSRLRRIKEKMGDQKPIKADHMTGPKATLLALSTVLPGLWRG